MENRDAECRFDIGVFEGPLDLLLYLIHRDELDIYDIPIEKITRQYMEYLGEMRRLDIDVAGEFIVMAASLMLIKSRSLLPVERRDGEDDEDDEDPRLDLVRQLVEYKKFKDAAGSLMRLEASQAECYLAGGEVVIGEGQDDASGLRLADASVSDLIRAFQEILRSRPVAPIDHLKPIVWSVPDKMDAILSRVAGGRTLRFTTLFTAESPRGEIIVTFLALLELVRQHRIRASQEREFAEIVVETCDEGAAGAIAEADRAKQEEDADGEG